MKGTMIKTIVALALVVTCSVLFAQPGGGGGGQPGGGPPPGGVGAPVDGGVFLLLLAIIIYARYRINQNTEIIS